MTLTNGRNTLQEHSAAAQPRHRRRKHPLHQQSESGRGHTDQAKNDRPAEHTQRIRLGSELNGLDQFLEPARRRSLLATTLE